MSVQHTESLVGKLLVASPHAHGTPYQRTVVLLLEHSEQEVMGVILDDELHQTLRRVSARLQNSRALARRNVRLPVAMQIRIVRWPLAQLEEELSHGVWMATPQSADSLESSRPSRDLWSELVRSIGRSVLRDALKIREFPQDPSLN